MTTSAATENPVPPILRHRPFTLFWLARMSSTVANQMLAVAVGWQIYALTGSALDLGLVGLVQFVPAVLLTLLVGHAADRYDRRLIARTCQVIEGLAAAGLAISNAAGWLDRDMIFAIIFLAGAARAFEAPTMHALVPGLVPAPLIPRAVAWSASANQSAIIAGPALGGVIYAAGPTVVYACCAVLFVSASVSIFLIRVALPKPLRSPLNLESAFAGIKFIRGRPTVLAAISLDLFAVLLGGATALLPIYARDILLTGPWGLGLLRSAPAVGALSMSIFLARHPFQRRVGRNMLAAVAIFGFATMIFAVSTSFVLSLAALAVLGASDMISVVIRNALVQIATPDEMRGRVSAVHSIFVGTSNQLGEFESGVTAAWFGTVPAVLLGGIGTVLVVLIWVRIFPELRRIDQL